MNPLARGAVAVLLALNMAGCSPKPAPPSANPATTPVEIIVSGAASLKEILEEAQARFGEQHPETKVRFNFGSSGVLQQQVEQGAPVDLFVAAATAPMDALVKQGLVDQAAVKRLASNRIVLIRGAAAAGLVQSWGDLRSERVKKIAIGSPQHVPVGQYAKSVLESLGAWSDLQPRLVLAQDVRQVLNYVSSGQAEAGIVYSTDAATTAKVTVVAEAPAGSHAPVTYPMAVLKGSKYAAQAAAFADFLLSPAGQEILTRHGFDVVGQ